MDTTLTRCSLYVIHLLSVFPLRRLFCFPLFSSIFLARYCDYGSCTLLCLQGKRIFSVLVSLCIISIQKGQVNIDLSLPLHSGNLLVSSPASFCLHCTAVKTVHPLSHNVPVSATDQSRWRLQDLQQHLELPVSLRLAQLPRGSTAQTQRPAVPSTDRDVRHGRG